MSGHATGTQLIEGLGALEQLFSGDTGHILDGFSIKRKDEGWLLVVAARRKGGNRIVAFFGGGTIDQCVERFLYDLWHKPGIKWLPDKYAK